ncbi:MAG: NIF family HAD-type phosphatase, partial [Nanoarchaeota archaeon]|nr:NIF family HAD-type phosphatase [Nanoarchaeota archaeon]
IEPIFFLRKFQKDHQKYDGKNAVFFDKEYYIAPRPRVKEFLGLASLHFTLVAFSVVEKEITLQKLTMMGLEGFFLKVYGKENLIDNKKSLKIIGDDLGIPLQDITAIDDTPAIFMETSEIIPIKPFYIGKEEYEYQEHQDNLMGALRQALRIPQAIEVIPSIL